MTTSHPSIKHFQNHSKKHNKHSSSQTLSTTLQKMRAKQSEAERGRARESDTARQCLDSSASSSQVDRSGRSSPATGRGNGDPGGGRIPTKVAIVLVPGGPLGASESGERRGV